jgi:peptidoglycan hydrolase-like protein with peptidoglycan-binding domain
MTTQLVKFGSFALSLFTGVAVVALSFGTSFQAAIAKSPKPSAMSAPTKPAVENPDPASNTPALQIGSKGQSVKELQGLLKKAGFYKGTATGVFGNQTQASVMKFQQAKHIKIDGVVGTKTWAALR